MAGGCCSASEKAIEVVILSPIMDLYGQQRSQFAFYLFYFMIFFTVWLILRCQVNHQMICKDRYESNLWKFHSKRHPPSDLLSVQWKGESKQWCAHFSSSVYWQTECSGTGGIWSLSNLELSRIILPSSNAASLKYSAGVLSPNINSMSWNVAESLFIVLFLACSDVFNLTLRCSKKSRKHTNMPVSKDKKEMEDEENKSFEDKDRKC